MCKFGKFWGEPPSLHREEGGERRAWSRQAVTSGSRAAVAHVALIAGGGGGCS
jgi:hypothetical protein